MTNFWARRLVLSYHFATRLLNEIESVRKLLLQLSEKLIKEIEMDGIHCNWQRKSSLGSLICVYKYWVLIFFSHKWELLGASSPVANVMIQWRKLSTRCFQRGLYLTLVSFKPTLFSPVNPSHMSAVFSIFPLRTRCLIPHFLCCNVQMFHLKTSKAEPSPSPTWMIHYRKGKKRLHWPSLEIRPTSNA